MCKDSFDAIEEQWKSLRVGLVEVKHCVHFYFLMIQKLIYLLIEAYCLWAHVSHTWSLLKEQVNTNSKMLHRSYMAT